MQSVLRTAVRRAGVGLRPRPKSSVAAAGNQAVDAAKASAPFVQSEEVYSYLTPGIRKPLPSELDWDNLGFQIRPNNGYVRFLNLNGKWDQGTFVPAPYVLLHINSGALHYGVSVFEGMKAFACKDGKIRVMNPTANARRMQEGAAKLRMPEVPTELFIEGVCEAVRRNAEYVPPYGHGASMYIRPLLFASGQMLGLAPLADEYTFFVTVMPAGGYFGKGGEGGITALVMEEHDRAAPMGTGNVKAAGNYAADLDPVHSAKAMGYGTTLYLDSTERRYIEEFSVANFVGITKDGKYVTPSAGSILKSTTNMCLAQLAKDEGLTVEVRPVDFDAEIDDFEEVGMCGTAAVVVNVTDITRKNKVHKFGKFDTLSRLRGKLQAIQFGEAEDIHGWMVEACDHPAHPVA